MRLNKRIKIRLALCQKRQPSLWAIRSPSPVINRKIQMSSFSGCAGYKPGDLVEYNGQLLKVSRRWNS